MALAPNDAFRGLLEAVRCGLPPTPGVPSNDLSTLLSYESTEEWESVLRLAIRHGVLPLARAGLQNQGITLPGRLEDEIRTRVLQRSLRTLALQAEAGRVAGLLREAGIPFVILKGLALRDAYGSLALRPFVDNDILIKPDTYPAFERIIVQKGDYIREQRTPWQTKSYLFIHGQYTYGRYEGTSLYTLDAHVSVMPFGYRYSDHVASLLERSRSVSVGATDVPVPSWEDEVVVLCVNGLKDLWGRLRLVADIVAVASRISDWGAVARIAERDRCTASVALGLTIAGKLFGVPFPSEMPRPSAGVSRIADDVVKRLRTNDHRMSEWERIRFFMTTQDDALSRLRYIAYTALRRGAEPFTRGTGVASAEIP